MSTNEPVSDTEAQGGCLCGAIRYRVGGVPLAQGRCHCRSCRRASGAPSVAWIVVRRADFAWTTGVPEHFRSSPPVDRTFCGRCGTPLTYQHDDSAQTIDVTTATLDNPEQFPPARDVWVEHKIGWEPLDPKLRHFRRGSSDGDGNAS